jgi:hypothetical protein
MSKSDAEKIPLPEEGSIDTSGAMAVSINVVTGLSGSNS